MLSVIHDDYFHQIILFLWKKQEKIFTKLFIKLCIWIIDGTSYIYEFFWTKSQQATLFVETDPKIKEK